MIAKVRKAPLDDYVVDTRMPDLIAHDRNPSAFVVYVKLWHACGGTGGRAVETSPSTPAVETGPSKSSVRAALRRLGQRGFLVGKRPSATAIPGHRVLAPWRR